GSRSRPFPVTRDDRDQDLVCQRDCLVLKPGELELADDGRAEHGPPWGCHHGDSSSPKPRPSASLGRGSSPGCHPCPYFGRSRVREMTESGIKDDFATLLGAWCGPCGACSRGGGGFAPFDSQSACSRAVGASRTHSEGVASFKEGRMKNR